jgi:hypothetical protein
LKTPAESEAGSVLAMDKAQVKGDDTQATAEVPFDPLKTARDAAYGAVSGDAAGAVSGLSASRRGGAPTDKVGDGFAIVDGKGGEVLTEAGVTSGGTDLKMQDMPDNFKSPEDAIRFLASKGMPDKNDQGQRDKFFDDVARNSLIEDYKADGVLPNQDKFTDDELGRAQLDSSFAREKQRHGMTELAERVGSKDQSEAEIKKAFDKYVMSTVGVQVGAKLETPADVFQVFRHSSAIGLQRKLGIMD